MKTKNSGAWIAIGISVGAGIGAATGNMALWLVIGASVGLVLNMVIPNYRGSR